MPTLDRLTDEQQTALTGQNSRLVIGAAGSGKTFLIASAAAQLAASLDDESVLVLTASSAAADALERQIDSLLESGCEPPAVTTPEGAALQVIRRAGDEREIAFAADRAELLAETADESELPELLRQRGWLASTDLLATATEHIRRWSEAIARPRLLVDRFEDLGNLEREFVVALAERSVSCLIAADDDQRLSAVEASATVDYLSASLPGLEAVRLENCFRSEGVLELWQCADDRAQAVAVCEQIERSTTDGQLDPEDICVLVRSLDREGEAVRTVLAQRDIHARVVGSYDPLRRTEVRDLLAWLRLLSDPLDNSATVRALTRPPIELRATDLAHCVQIARRRKLDLISALSAATESPQVAPESRERIAKFLKLQRSATAALDRTRPERFVYRLIDHLELRSRHLFSAQAESVDRLLALGELVRLAGRYEQMRPLVSARDFTFFLKTAVAVDEFKGPGIWRAESSPLSVSTSGVRIMSLAAAKGVECEHVYVLGLDAARMPGPRKGDDTASEPLGEGTSLRSHRDAMRRLLNVACTRARQRTVLSYAQKSPRESQQQPSPFLEKLNTERGLQWISKERSELDRNAAIRELFTQRRSELVKDLRWTGQGLSELRLDTGLEIAHATVRYLELAKLAALLELPPGQSIADTLPEINARLRASMTAEQQAIFAASELDTALLNESAALRRKRRRDDTSLVAFLPKHGDGLVLSASDMTTYRSCPLKYKFARIFRLPQEPTVNQRFGILVHQVLERFHEPDRERSLDTLLSLLESSWQRAGMGDGENDAHLRELATGALEQYYDRFERERPETVWLERSFAFPLGDSLLRGRVDRVDRLPDGSYELIDYKTGHARRQQDLHDDIQLSLYAIAAREAWQIECSLQSYYFVIDDEKVAVPSDEIEPGWIERVTEEVTGGILNQEFEPTPSYAACSNCEFRIACPAAET